MDAEEDIQDFRPLRPGLDPPEIVVLFLCSELAFHLSRLHSGKFLSDKVFLFFFSPNGRPLFTKDVFIPFSLQWPLFSVTSFGLPLLSSVGIISLRYLILYHARAYAVDAQS